jgi:uncharacterized protein YlxP (DUF503 family)
VYRCERNENTILVLMTSLLLLKSPCLLSHLVFSRVFNKASGLPLRYCGWMVASAVAMSEVEGLQTNRLLLLLVLHTLVLHRRFSLCIPRMMASDAESVFVVSVVLGCIEMGCEKNDVVNLAPTSLNER